MNRTWPQLLDSLNVILAAIAFVGSEAITGVLLIIGFHESIPSYLGQN